MFHCVDMREMYRRLSNRQPAKVQCLLAVSAARSEGNTLPCRWRRFTLPKCLNAFSGWTKVGWNLA